MSIQTEFIVEPRHAQGLVLPQSICWDYGAELVAFEAVLDFVFELDPQEYGWLSVRQELDLHHTLYSRTGLCVKRREHVVEYFPFHAQRSGRAIGNSAKQYKIRDEHTKSFGRSDTCARNDHLGCIYEALISGKLSVIQATGKFDDGEGPITDEHLGDGAHLAAIGFSSAGISGDENFPATPFRRDQLTVSSDDPSDGDLRATEIVESQPLVGSNGQKLESEYMYSVYIDHCLAAAPLNPPVGAIPRRPPPGGPGPTTPGGDNPGPTTPGSDEEPRREGEPPRRSPAGPGGTIRDPSSPIGPSIPATAQVAAQYSIWSVFATNPRAGPLRVGAPGPTMLDTSTTPPVPLKGHYLLGSHG